MKYLALFSLICCMSSFAFDAEHGFPEGLYKGTGRMSEGDDAVTYRSEIAIRGNLMMVGRQWESGAMGYEIEFVFREHGTFTVVMDGLTVGEGTCEENTCAYDANDGGSKTWSEEFSFGDDGSLHISGHSNSNGPRGNIAFEWSEDLQFFKR